MKGDKLVQNNVIDDMLKNQIPNPKKKNKSGIFVFFIIFLLLIVAAGALVFFYLKNNKKMIPKDQFLQYLTKSNFSNILSLEKYNILTDRMKSNSFEAVTEVTGDVSELLKGDFDLSDMKIEINSKSIPEDSKKSSDISLKYKEGNIIDFEILSNEDEIGLFSEEIVTKYLASKYSNLEKVINKFLSNNESLSEANIDFGDLEKQDFVFPEVSDEVYKKYIDIINQRISETSFSSKKVTLDRNSQKLNVTEYSMSLNEEQAINLLDQILKTLQDDDELLDASLSFIEDNSEVKEIIKSQIEVFINSLYERDIDNNNKYTIKIYGTDDIIYRISFDFAQKNSIDIDFEYKENESSINITFLENETQNGCSINFIKTTSDVSENLNLSFNEIQSSEIVGKAVFSSDLENSRKFI